jgi:uncharacterized metal-binding protein
MPNGRTHDIITAVTAPVVAGVTYYLTKDIKITAIIFGLFLFSSLMFNGDLDIDSRPYNRWWVLKMIWIPYQLMFEHRSIFTHGLIIGTIIRILYISAIPFTICAFKGQTQVLTNITTLHTIIIIFIGLELGSAVHTISDKLFS